MARDLDRQRQFTRRALLLGGGQALLLTALAGRLYHLQVIESERFVTLAEDNRINLRLLPPQRGRILDRRGRPLAVNRQDFRVVVIAEQAGSVDAALDKLAALVPLAEADRKRVLREVARHRRFVPISVRDNLAWEDVAAIEVNALELPGIVVEEGQSRAYPYGPVLSHVLGYVGAVAEQDVGSDPLLELPGFRIGKAGVEKTYEQRLRGTGGSSQIEVNAVGRVIRELDRREGEPGEDLRLSIDLELQQLAMQRLEGESGAAVVLDVHSGEVLALASNPGYDPSAFNRGLSVAEWKALVADTKAPLTNKAVAGQYAPGSTFKMVVALAGLERGVITPATVVYCPGAYRIGDATFHCWRRGGHGGVALRDALAQSCDCYFYEVARRVGADRIAAAGLRLGLGAPLGIDLPNERPGLLPTRDWKAAKMGKPWTTGETVITGIGQGYTLATPLQLAVMTARIANGGRAVVPRVVSEPVPAAPEPPRLDFPQAHLRLVQEGMDWVVNNPRGTAKTAAIRVEGLQMAGKTGTSQVRRISRAERQSGVIRNEQLPWERRDHALFVGYAPVAAPRFACAVVIEHGGAGSKAAAPVARDILLAAQRIEAVRIAAGEPHADPSGAAPRAPRTGGG